MKPVTILLKTTVNRIGELPVGSAWAAAWLIVTVGGVTSRVTTLSVLVEAAFGFPAVSVAAPAGTLATTVPFPVIPVTVTV